MLRASNVAREAASAKMLVVGVLHVEIRAVPRVLLVAVAVVAVETVVTEFVLMIAVMMKLWPPAILI